MSKENWRPYANYGTVTEASPTVAVTGGTICGYSKDGVAIFAGVHYGGVPSGEKRFLPPPPVEPWEGVRSCVKPGFAAVQPENSANMNPVLFYSTGGRAEEIGILEEQSDEDCLVLNVLTPGMGGKKRPVIFYIHGGGYANGSGIVPLGADKWVREEDIVLVSVNHRLNVFGYLYLGAFDETYADSGNVGLLDLVQALEWVRDNIAKFGGDPDNVTLMGESGGGSKVNHLCVMERAKGLFQRAIIESGAAMPGEGMDCSLQGATENAKKLLDRLGVSPDDLSPLLTLPARDIFNATMDPELGFFGGIMFNPVCDSRTVFPNPNPGQFTALPITYDLPMILGSTQDEMAAFGGPEHFTQTWETLPKFLAERSGSDLETVEKVIARYRELEPENDAVTTYFRISSDRGFTGGTIEELDSRQKPGIAKTWRYLFTWDVPASTPFGPVMAAHTSDLPLEFRLVYYPESEKLSRMLAHAWAQFARTGDPSDDWLAWPAYEPEKKYCMMFDLEPHLESDPDGAQHEAVQALKFFL